MPSAAIGIRTLLIREKAFRAQLEKIRRQGYGVEYQAELSTILRVVVPVPLPGEKELRFAVGFVANFVYLLDVKSCLEPLRAAAREVAALLHGKVPHFRFDEKVPEPGEPAWAVRPLREPYGRCE